MTAPALILQDSRQGLRVVGHESPSSRFEMRRIARAVLADTEGADDMTATGDLPLTNTQRARSLAHRAVTEGVNLKYVEQMRRGLYDAADELDAAEAWMSAAQHVIDAARVLMKAEDGNSFRIVGEIHDELLGVYEALALFDANHKEPT